MAEIGKKIKYFREILGMTQEELAKKLGYKSKTTIAKIELGTNDISQSKVVEFAKALNTTPAQLMGWEEPEMNKTNKKPTFPLSPEEQQLVLAYRSADEIDKTIVKRTLKMDAVNAKNTTDTKIS